MDLSLTFHSASNLLGPSVPLQMSNHSAVHLKQLWNNVECQLSLKTLKKKSVFSQRKQTLPPPRRALTWPPRLPATPEVCSGCADALSAGSLVLHCSVDGSLQSPSLHGWGDGNAKRLDHFPGPRRWEVRGRDQVRAARVRSPPSAASRGARPLLTHIPLDEPTRRAQTQRTEQRDGAVLMQLNGSDADSGSRPIFLGQGDGRT